MAETRKRLNDGGQRILGGLNEALEWAKGNGTAHVTLPGRPGREMTRQEYEMERTMADAKEAAALPSPPASD